MKKTKTTRRKHAPVLWSVVQRADAPVMVRSAPAGCSPGCSEPAWQLGSSSEHATPAASAGLGPVRADAGPSAGFCSEAAVPALAAGALLLEPVDAAAAVSAATAACAVAASAAAPPASAGSGGSNSAGA